MSSKENMMLLRRRHEIEEERMAEDGGAYIDIYDMHAVMMEDI